MLYKTENPHGGDVYAGNIELDFSANTNPFGTPDSVKAAVSACLDSLSFYPDPYCRRLVAAVAAQEKVPESFVLCGAGAAELIYSYAAAERPKSMVELAPTFAEYSLPLPATSISRFFLKEENGFRVTETLLDHIVETRPDTVFICNPNNPTGL
ncbi:MAG: aminotransferase class I/II-fold pyridoxal phosphate-dependent enzyme, partial [Firmicutes bacterium]|nr:aminotransferase class I/II-fold pyridoxal phosphate-dependent enzyme [Bacillota bacterium]